MSENISHAGKARKFVRIGDGCTALTGITVTDITLFQMISNGTIYFEEVMFEKGGTCQIEEVIVREKKGTGALQKANMLLMFFKKSDIVTACGADFAWTANTTSAELIGAIEIAAADYREYYSGGAAESAIAFKIPTQPIPIVVTEDYQKIFCIPVGLGVGTTNYSTDSELDIELVVNQD